MSPGQARGKNSEVDARTDVWAPGAIVHERLTKTPAFAVDTMTSLLAGVLVNPAPSLRGREGIPAHVASTLDQALAKDAEQRWADMPSFVAALTCSLAQHLCRGYCPTISGFIGASAPSRSFCADAATFISVSVVCRSSTRALNSSEVTF